MIEQAAPRGLAWRYVFVEALQLPRDLLKMSKKHAEIEHVPDAACHFEQVDVWEEVSPMAANFVLLGEHMHALGLRGYLGGVRVGSEQKSGAPGTATRC